MAEEDINIFYQLFWVLISKVEAQQSHGITEGLRNSLYL